MADEGLPVLVSLKGGTRGTSLAIRFPLGSSKGSVQPLREFPLVGVRTFGSPLGVTTTDGAFVLMMLGVPDSGRVSGQMLALFTLRDGAVAAVDTVDVAPSFAAYGISRAGRGPPIVFSISSEGRARMHQRMTGTNDTGTARALWRSTELPGQRHLELPVIGGEGADRWLYSSALPDGPLRFGADARREVRAVRLRCRLPL